MAQLPVGRGPCPSCSLCSLFKISVYYSTSARGPLIKTGNRFGTAFSHRMWTTGGLCSPQTKFGPDALGLRQTTGLRSVSVYYSNTTALHRVTSGFGPEGTFSFRRWTTSGPRRPHIEFGPNSGPTSFREGPWSFVLPLFTIQIFQNFCLLFDLTPRSIQ